MLTNTTFEYDMKAKLKEIKEINDIVDKHKLYVDKLCEDAIKWRTLIEFVSTYSDNDVNNVTRAVCDMILKLEKSNQDNHLPEVDVKEKK